MQEVPSKRYNHEDGRELASEKLSPRDGKHRGREEDEEKEKKGENSNEMQESSDRSSNAKGAEPDVGKLSPGDTRHKKREEKEEEVLESDKVQEVLSKMYPGEQHREVELAPSCDNIIRGGNPASPEPRYYSNALSIQAVSSHGVSLPGSDYNFASRENDVTDIETTLSLEARSDKDSKSVLESSIELDSDESDSDEKIWEEIHADEAVSREQKDKAAMTQERPTLKETILQKRRAYNNNKTVSIEFRRGKSALRKPSMKQPH